MTSMGTYIFLDTNIFLHYQYFDQIDWRSILDVEAVTMIIPPVTVRELNHHKDNPQSNKRVKKRAGETLTKISHILEAGSNLNKMENVEIVLEDRDPTIDFTYHKLNSEINDDHLIASIIMHKEENPNSEVILITSDNGLLLKVKAKRFGIRSIMLDEKYKLKEVPDLDKEEIKKLRKELESIKNTFPKLAVIFPNEKQFFGFNLPKPITLSDSEIDRLLETEKSKFPKIEEKRQLPNSTQLTRTDNPELFREILASAMSTVSDEDIIDYNKQLDDYFRLYSDSVRRSIEFKNKLRRIIRLDIALTNTGTAPGADLDINLHFKRVSIVNVSLDSPIPPNELKPPSPPKTIAEKMKFTGLFLPGYYNSNGLSNLQTITRDLDGTSPRIKISDLFFEVNYYVSNIKHGIMLPLDPIFVTFESFDSAASFGINYSILAANVPDKISGSLNVVIDK